MMSETDSTTISRAFLKVVEQAPDRAALVFQDEVYTYAMLHDLAAAFAIRLREAGVGAQSTVQVHVNDLAVVMGALLATSCLGARFAEQSITGKLPLDRPITHRIVAKAQADLENQVVVDQSFSPANFSREEKSAIWQASAVDANAPWIIVATSGTTGLPKAVALSQQLVCRRSFAVRYDFEAGKTRFASLFPYPSRPFLARGMAAILGGATIVERGTWAFWQDTNVTMVSGSLAQVRSALDIPAGASPLPKLEIIGAKLATEEAAGLLAHFAIVDDTYGATETSKSWSNLYTRGADGALVVRGQPVSAQFEIVDENGKPVEAGTPGTLRVKSECAARAYLFAGESGEDLLQDGWFYPGDIGRFGPEGNLDIIGRDSADVISIKSNKINGKLIDFVLESIDGIVAAAAFASPKAGADEILAFIEFEEGQNMAQSIELARHTCRERLGPDYVPAKLWPINRLPRAKNGAVDRVECANLIMAAIKAQ